MITRYILTYFEGFSFSPFSFSRIGRHTADILVCMKKSPRMRKNGKWEMFLHSWGMSYNERLDIFSFIIYLRNSAIVLNENWQETNEIYYKSLQLMNFSNQVSVKTKYLFIIISTVDYRAVKRTKRNFLMSINRTNF